MEDIKNLAINIVGGVISGFIVLMLTSKDRNKKP